MYGSPTRAVGDLGEFLGEPLGESPEVAADARCCIRKKDALFNLIGSCFSLSGPSSITNADVCGIPAGSWFESRWCVDRVRLLWAARAVELIRC